jgi:hypothetical protein
MQAFSATSKEGVMLVRRFTIVCLLVTLFGMAFAILVAEAGRDRRPYQTVGMAP